jgi:REP element-mobilizing transposase RayT
MGHRQRWYVTDLVYEVTIRTLFGQFWLRPDPACRAIIDGVFGKALALYKDVRLHAYDAQSNHLHYLCSAAADPDQLALFIDYVHGNIARQLNDLREREGTFWSRRASVIAVLDGAAQIDRLRYILAQGPKSNLVASPRDWPGACSTRALLGDMTIPAVYRSLDARRRNARRPNPRPDAELAHDVAITLAPLPVWADLDPAALRAKHAALVAEIEAEHAGATVLGVAHLIAEDPDATPATARALARARLPRLLRPRPRPLPRRLRHLPRPLQARLRAPAQAPTADSDEIAAAIAAHYPPGALVRPRWYIPAPDNLAATWLRGIDDADLALA